MVAVSYIIILALVSSTVTAQPRINTITGLRTYLGGWGDAVPITIPTKSVHERIPLGRCIWKQLSSRNSIKIGLSYILKKLGLQSNEFKVKTSLTDRSRTTHLYGVPLYLGLPIGNLHAAAHVKNGQVFFYSATIGNNQRLKKRSLTLLGSDAKISAEQAVKTAVDRFLIPLYIKVIPIKECYSLNDDYILVWRFQLRNEPVTEWLEVIVDANTGVIVSSQDFKRSFTYTGIELPNESPEDGFSEIVDPENLQSSPEGWTDNDKTFGNNAWVGLKSNSAIKSTSLGVFSTQFDATTSLQTPANIAASAVNAFYVVNMFHDIMYQYGFNEQAGNFQYDNFGKGGKDRDDIEVYIHHNGFTNNAECFTPPDGQHGIIKMGIYTTTQPNRDSALDSSVLVHELGHGLSNRLSGGALTAKCVTTIEANGMGEGYSDMIALVFTDKSADTRWTKKGHAIYSEGDPRGVRRYPYTTDMEVNPLTYKDVAGEKRIHRLGTIWASMLLEVYWNLVDEYGFSANLHDATQKKGNIIFLQLFVGTLMIQPCGPTFISARDAMLAADDAYYGGVNKCFILKGFAKRGLGVGADSSLTDDYSIPQECQGDRYIRPAADSCIKPIEPLRVKNFVIDL
ncbi:hypothetical protein BASA83_001616 [Batrachochytrium salamandrivorans]|nr:hypothetical protein BASA83_001616 [Batrachochytrium salamandrivorans]